MPTHQDKVLVSFPMQGLSTDILNMNIWTSENKHVCSWSRMNMLLIVHIFVLNNYNMSKFNRLSVGVEDLATNYIMIQRLSVTKIYTHMNTHNEHVTLCRATLMTLMEGLFVSHLSLPPSPLSCFLSFPLVEFHSFLIDF